MKNTIILLALLLVGHYSVAQEIKGRVIDANSGEAIIMANVIFKGTSTGTSTDFDGNFTLPLGKNSLPITLELSFIGYQKKEVVVKSLKDPLVIELSEDSQMLASVDIIEQRLSAKQRESALTVEALDNLAIKETPAANFYEALGNLKGVDLTSASIGFKIINTRGFNSTSPVRSLQLIDGVDNQAPGLNFSLGNFLGANELDILNVDIIAGASTAFYGPGAFNGVISMTTKDPFRFQGLSFSQKVGERALSETSVRYAEAFKLFNKEREDFAFKINLFYLRADDWEADNYDPIDDSDVGADNPGRYDAVNIYGDESLASNNERGSFSDVKFNDVPGLGTFYRPGFKEPDLVNYDTRNFKGNIGLFYRTEKDVQFSYTLNYGTGTTVYQGENRFSLNGIRFMQNIVEVKKKDKFFIRAYATNEDAGESYDAVLTAFKMNDIMLGDEGTWNQNYAAAWKRPFRFNQAFQTAAGFNVGAATFDSAFFNNEYQDILREYNELLAGFHDSLLNIVSTGRYAAGTAQYDSIFNDVTGKTFTEGGSRFYDKSALYHIMGEYQLTVADRVKMRMGGNFRMYTPNSRGNIFDEIIPSSIVTDSVGNIISQEYRTITNQEFGVYYGAETNFFGEVLKASATVRMDKNQNFDYLFSPAFSLVYNINPKHTLRTSLGRAIRNPTLQDQYLRYDVGRAVLLGNIDGYNNLVSLESFDFYRSQPQLDRDNLTFFDVAPIEPERVTTAEIGYRGSWFKRVFVDVNYFHSWYTSFIGFQFGLDLSFDQNVPDFVRSVRAYRVAANAQTLVTTQGLNIGINYYIDDHLSLGGNYSYNSINLNPGRNFITETFYADQLSEDGEEDPIIPAFNTPENKFNLSFSGRNYRLKKGSKNNFGFAVTYKWIEGFRFEGSPQFTGFINSYDLLDAQMSYTVDTWHSTFKLGASNLLNNKVFQVYGGPRVGRLAYFSIVYEFDHKR
ncbi:MAG: TonB-dependent receptor [Bacteroidetes bacterium]|nr:MAG: TonB-dependent receptor [Bacteroidota bacterium]